MIAYFIQWDTDGDKNLFRKLPDVVELPTDQFSLKRCLEDANEESELLGNKLPSF